jgi:hypothetical protein
MRFQVQCVDRVGDGCLGPRGLVPSSEVKIWVAALVYQIVPVMRSRKVNSSPAPVSKIPWIQRIDPQRTDRRDWSNFCCLLVRMLTAIGYREIGTTVQEKERENFEN